jgi:hypothetical protein
LVPTAKQSVTFVQLTEFNCDPDGIVVGGLQVCPLLVVSRAASVVVSPDMFNPTATQVVSRVHEIDRNSDTGWSSNVHNPPDNPIIDG